jgi:hypothetical protein
MERLVLVFLSDKLVLVGFSLGTLDLVSFGFSFGQIGFGWFGFSLGYFWISLC